MNLKALINSETSHSQRIVRNQLSLLWVIGGGILLAIMAQIAIPLPFTPVPITLQTFTVSFLAIILGARRASLAVLFYLFQATIGLPVLAGGISNSLWLIGPKAGYLLGFVISAYVVGKLLERCQQFSLGKLWLLFALNEGIILSIGTLWLGLFVGKEAAFFMGMLPFLPGAVLKITMAMSFYKLIHK